MPPGYPSAAALAVSCSVSGPASSRKLDDELNRGLISHLEVRDEAACSFESDVAHQNVVRSKGL